MSCAAKESCLPQRLWLAINHSVQALAGAVKRCQGAQRQQPEDAASQVSALQECSQRLCLRHAACTAPSGGQSEPVWEGRLPTALGGSGQAHQDQA